MVTYGQHLGRRYLLLKEVQHLISYILAHDDEVVTPPDIIHPFPFAHFIQLPFNALDVIAGLTTGTEWL